MINNFNTVKFDSFNALHIAKMPYSVLFVIFRWPQCTSD